ncbi:MAG: DUF2461 domain-containing protein [Sphingobacteriales bacterium JAD_PAG50586_3]|nr:MAG: DUF2461 domain-containing protein [Sphingobacteriales bacterium JAD_PAG50586_3]
MAVTISPDTIKFLADLDKNNNREWFLANKKRYETAKKNYADFIDELIAKIAKFEPGVANFTAKDCMFRINRDVRFSANKSPYKNNFGAGISKGGKKMNTAGFYIHLQPNNSFVAGGLWMPEGDNLKKIRDAIDYDFEKFDKIVTSKEAKKLFGALSDEAKLKTAPKGYPKDHPAIEYLKHKSYVFYGQMDDKEVTSPGYADAVVAKLKAIKPLCDFLNEALEYKE